MGIYLRVGLFSGNYCTFSFYRLQKEDAEAGFGSVFI